MKRKFLAALGGVVIAMLFYSSNVAKSTKAVSTFPLQDKTMIAIGTGFNHSIALSDEGQVYTWGHAPNGALGLGPTQTTNVKEPTLVTAYSPALEEGEVITCVTAFREVSFAITSQNRIYGWGNNIGTRHLANPSLTTQYYPTDITSSFSSLLSEGEHIQYIVGGNNHAYAYTSQQQVIGWSSNNQWKQILTLDLGTGAQAPTNFTNLLPLNAGEKVLSISSFDNGASVLTSQHRVLTWGQNNYAQLGDGTYSDRLAPVDITASFLYMGANDYIDEVKTGSRHGLARSHDGLLYVWGYNGFGQLGTGNTSTFTSPSCLNALTPRFDTISGLSAAFNQSFILSNDGMKMFGSGDNTRGELGVNYASSSYEFRDVYLSERNLDSRIISITSGYAHTLFLSEEGRIYAAGANEYGELGINSNTIQIAPARLFIGTFTITFVPNNGTTIDPITQIEGSTITYPAMPTKEGHNFVNWYTNSDLTGGYNSTIMPDYNLTLYAGYVTNSYTITFKDYDDTVLRIEQIAYGDSTSGHIPTPPFRPLYTFVGWDSEVPATMPAQNLTLTAVYQGTNFNVTFQSNGGTSLDSLSVPYNSLVTPTQTPTREEYHFEGWYLDQDLTQPLDGTYTMPDHNITLYAKWSVITYTLSFYDDSNNLLASHEVASGIELSSITIPTPPTIEGKTFIGWSHPLPTTMPSSALTLTAQYGNNQTISFVSNGGSSLTPLTIAAGAGVGNLPTPTLTGYSFVGWYEDAECSNLYTDTIMKDASFSLYAKWSINQYSIFFVDYNQSPISSIQINYGSSLATVTYPSSPTRSGYSFSGWSSMPNIMPANNLTITAQYSYIDPVISGVSDNQIFTSGSQVAITFDKGSATLNDVAYTSGSNIQQPGQYTFVLSDGDYQTTLHFTIEAKPGFNALWLLFLLLPAGLLGYIKRQAIVVFVRKFIK